MFLGFISFPFVGCAVLFLFLATERANDFALSVQQLQLDVLFGLLFQVVVERRALGGIFSDGVAAPPGVPHARTNGGTRREQVRIFAGNGSVRLAQRADVIEHPERAAMRGHHQIVAVNDEVVHWSCRQVELQRLPVRAIVKGNPSARFRTRI